MSLGFNIPMFPVAVAAVVASSVVVAAPAAEAVTVGSTLNIAGGSVRFNPSTGVLDFRPDTPFGVTPILVGEGTGSFSDTGLFAGIRDLTLINSGGDLFELSAPKNNFLTAINVSPLNSGFNDVQFTLTEFVFNAKTGDTTLLKGFFTQNGQTIAAEGRFTSQYPDFAPSTYSMSLIAVPTPALLPGLLGMGIAFLRNGRKQNEDELSTLDS